MTQLPFPQPSSADGTQFSGQPTLPEGDWSANTAVVEALLDSPNKYQVKFEGTYWRAIAALDSPNPAVGDTVAVVGREGNELIVQTLVV
ncbi:NfeD family protein [Nodosilinea sp. P-1105]|uniref:NfeD family protein n=1 Tax=Nodosilinea sp. P-1105 TaxID=2546229 RepID=UPI00146CAAF3|nr:NfeD family protein [Nodosilinea sp. P-1105]NMF86182.1 hypothetical protein [Nodosilinea sp. P-1105]